MPTDDYNGVLWKIETKKPGVKLVISPPGIFIPKNGWSKDDSLKIDERVKKNGVARFEYKQPVRITEFGTYAVDDFANDIRIEQKFFFNKATGKKIMLATEAAKAYPGDGAFTLVNGVQNDKGLAKGSEFLGFLGKDLDATIDLKYDKGDISKVTLHVLDQNGSWIYLPKQVEVTYIPDIDYTVDDVKYFPKEVRVVDVEKEKGLSKIVIESKQNCRYVKVVAKNFGIIPSSSPGAGNPAWLFVDEIEVE
jgi:hexosaminidase